MGLVEPVVKYPADTNGSFGQSCTWIMLADVIHFVIKITRTVFEYLWL